MYKRLSYLIFLVIFFLGFNTCSLTDDTGTDTEIPINVTILGRNNNVVLQANIIAGTNITNFNLTETLGIPSNGRLMDLHNYENTLGYYFSLPYDDTYTVWEKDIDTDVGTSYSGFCNETSIETPYFPQVSGDHITVFSAELISTGNRVLNLRIYNKAFGFCSKTSIGIADQFQQLSRLIVGNKILTYHFNDQGQTVISKMSMDTGALEGQLTFETSGAATVRNNVLYYYPRSGDISQMSYDVATLQLLDSSSFAANPFLNEGLFKTESRGNSILIDMNYIQPFQFVTFPALLDQDSGETTKLADLGVINNNLISYLDTDLAVETSQTYTVDLDNNILVGSYTAFNFDLSIIEYGIYFSYFSGRILGQMPIDFAASKVIIQ